MHEFAVVGTDLQRPECVLTNARGEFFVSDKRGGVLHILPSGEQRLYGQSSLIPNGVAMRRDGSFLVANLSDEGGVWAVTRDGKVEPYLIEIGGRRLPSVNFIWIDQYERLWICVSSVRPGDDQYRWNIADGFIALQDASGTRIVADQLCWTNECRLTPDGRHFYVNETFGRRLTRFDVGADGALSNRTVFATFGTGIYPDGLTLDEDGGLWVVSVISNAVLRVSPEGEVATVLSDPDPRLAEFEQAYADNTLTRPQLYGARGQRLSNVTSLAFGGPERRTAYLGALAADHLISFETRHRGVKPVHWDW